MAACQGEGRRFELFEPGVPLQLLAPRTGAWRGVRPALPLFSVAHLNRGSSLEARAFLETMRKVWSRAELSPALLREPGAAAASPQARIVQEIESRDY